MNNEQSTNMKSVIELLNNSYIRSNLATAIDVDSDIIYWDKFNYHSKPSSLQTVISWIYCLYFDEIPPLDWSYRDPFDGFFSLDRDIQTLIFKAMAIRHGYLDFTLIDKPKSDFEKIFEKQQEEIIKAEKRKGFKILKKED